MQVPTDIVALLDSPLSLRRLKGSGAEQAPEVVQKKHTRSKKKIRKIVAGLQKKKSASSKKHNVSFRDSIWEICMTRDIVR